MDYGVVLSSAFITALAFVLIMYYLLFKATPEN
jgi:hypothetical protein